MATQTKRKTSSRKSDPNQLSLLDYAPASKTLQAKVNVKPLRRASITRASNLAAAPKVLTAQEAATYLRVSIATLKSWRAKQTGPAFVKRGARLIGYRSSDLEAYMTSQI